MPTYSMSPSRLGYTCDSGDDPVHDRITGDCYDNACEAEAAGARLWDYGCAEPVAEPAYAWGPSGWWGGDGGWWGGNGGSAFPWRRRGRRHGGGGVPRAGGPRGGGRLRLPSPGQPGITMPPVGTPGTHPNVSFHPSPRMTAPTTTTRMQISPAGSGARTMPSRGGAARMASPTSRGMRGLGQDTATVDTRWKYAALGLGALVIVQAWWWNKKAPNVLKLGY